MVARAVDDHVSCCTAVYRSREAVEGVLGRCIDYHVAGVWACVRPRGFPRAKIHGDVGGSAPDVARHLTGASACLHLEPTFA